MRALGSMPGGAGGPIEAAARRVGFDDLANPVAMDLESIATYLETLRDTYARWRAEEQERSAELKRLRKDIAAARRVFGIEGGSHG